MSTTDPIAAAYDPETFRQKAHDLVDRLADHLARAARREGPVLPWTDPAASVAAWPADFAPRGGADLVGLLERVVARSNHLHHPRFVGHQVSAPLPAAVLADFVASLLNNGMAVYEMGPVSTAMERSLVRWFADRVGFGAAADGIFTSGGSAGNLTALLVARQAKAGFDVWKRGAHAGPPLVVLASEETHYSVKRSAQILGLGEAGVIAIPVDARRRARPRALDFARRRAEAEGQKVIAVVASAGSTSTGAYDPLEPIADFCAEHDLWLHVDGAHGACAALSSRHKEKLRGIHRADSVVWDAHKMMMMPALVTMVLFRDGARSYEAFSQKAEYLFAAGDPADTWYDAASRTLECTKRMMCLKVYAVLAALGPDLLAEHVDRAFALAERFAASLRAEPDFELALPPECNIVCFRYIGGAARGASAEERDAIQSRIREALCRSGAFYLVQTRLHDGIYLRTALMNPLTTDDDLAALVAAVRAHGGSYPPSSKV